MQLTNNKKQHKNTSSHDCFGIGIQGLTYILTGLFKFQEEEEKNLEQRIQELLKYEDGKKVLFGIFTLAIKPTQGKKFGNQAKPR